MHDSVNTDTEHHTAAIIGAGVYGTALGNVMISKGHTVRYYDKFNEQFNQFPLSEVLADVDVIVLSIPSQAVPDFLDEFPREFCHLPFISATKGILDPAVFDVFVNFSVLSGPGFAEKIEQKIPTTLTSTSLLASDLLATDWMTIEFTTDTRGIMTCGTLGGIYPIGAGLQHLQPDTPEFDSYIRLALKEMKQAIQILGGHPDTADFACGIGDLVLKCGSSLSRNFQFGLCLARDPECWPQVTTEGLNALLALPPELKELPLIHAILQKIKAHEP
ncbi:hypothetical protein FWC63_00205 [Candidatus Saccharibacteria bacterium]|nr:hypothetical protein [Candidatus Saccharibacteria bacterium]